MMMSGRSGDSHDPGRHRLAGWKEIAAHCGKGVRTVQRWEREHRFPVHRMQTVRAETVFAWSDEVDDWLREHPPSSRGTAKALAAEEQPALSPASAIAPSVLAVPSEGPPRRRLPLAWRWLVPVASLAASVVIIAAGAIAIPGLRRPSEEPAAISVDLDRVRALDVEGRELWQYSVGRALKADRYVAPYRGEPPFLIEDVDHDGHREVLFRAIGASGGQEQPLYCLNSDGSFRFSWSHRRTVEFGGVKYSPPFLVLTMLPGTRAGRPVLWASASHYPYYPTVLVALDVRSGQPVVEHWNPGHITTLAHSRYMGRDVLFAGGIDNSRKDAVVLVIDPEGPSSSMPVDREYYRCSSCPPAAPLAALVLPTPDLTTLAGKGGLPSVSGFSPSNTNTLVTVRYPALPYPGESNGASLGLYTLDPELRPVHVELQADYEKRHRFAERAGLIPHAYSENEVSQMLPIRMSVQGGPWQPRPLHAENPKR